MLQKALRARNHNDRNYPMTIPSLKGQGYFPRAHQHVELPFEILIKKSFQGWSNPRKH